MNYEKPTPIQCQALPCVLQGRDVIGIAKTGSGKTLAYVIPMVIHVIDQRVLKRGEGPIGLVVAPTRELCQQIGNVAKRYASPYAIKVLSLFGGESKQEQWKMILAGVEVVISTPGRLIELVRKKAFNLSSRCTFVAVDEADIMFNMGFEYQIRMILGQVRPERQIVMFSATFPKKIQSLVQDVLRNPAKIVIGKLGNANEDVSQQVLVFENPDEKLNWLMCNLAILMMEGQVLIFANQIKTVEELARTLSKLFPNDIVYLHGDKMQHERSEVLYKFRKAEARVLVSTNVASRGLDIPRIRTVVSYEPAKDRDDHTHRVGRTGRAGDKSGVAYTLLLKAEYNKAGMLVEILQSVGQSVPEELLKLAKADPRYRAQHQKIGIRSFNTEIDAHRATADLKQKQKTTSFKRGLGFQRGDRACGRREESDTWGEMQTHSKAFEEAVGLGPAAAKQKMQEHYANQMKWKYKSQLRSGFTAGGSINDTRTKPTVMYLEEGQMVERDPKAEGQASEQSKLAGKRDRLG
eukprot:TRINITY_DN14241_c0_g2_i1.p1 TRINITY_DN14241_c0_g2~~TRINITY_DN14241_c0_g2_i1.p1  ORF type:complete len:521 (+),score=168.95 TRINITY_DN14241_c0_g2_i1:697-2259(+)